MSTFLESTPLTQWNRFIDYHCKHWRGLWTRYNPDGSIFESFPSERILIATPDRQQVSHTNYEHRESKVTKKNWKYRFGEKNQNHLFQTKTHYMPTGELIWTTPRFTGENFLNDAFFFRVDRSTRCSVTVLYDPKGELFRVTNIRETEDGVPSPWSTSIELESARSVPREVIGQGVQSNCQNGETPAMPLTICWPEASPSRREFFLPDGISVSSPIKVTEENEMLIVVDLQLEEGRHYREQIRFPEGWTWPEYTVVRGKITN